MKTVDFDGKPTTPTKIICVGKNYKEHIEEMGSSKPPMEPVLFLKPNSSIAELESVFIPEAFGLLHHEIELCFIVGKTCKAVDENGSKDLIVGAGVGIDFTLRHRQAIAKDKGEPWELSKGFDSSAVFGKFVRISDTNKLSSLPIKFKLNGKIKQDSNTKHMIFSPPKILSYASQFMTIEEGDVFMCGTPKGVGEIKHNDFVEASIGELPGLRFRIVRRR